jgi:hypothetical protein
MQVEDSTARNTPSCKGPGLGAKAMLDKQAHMEIGKDHEAERHMNVSSSIDRIVNKV